MCRTKISWIKIFIFVFNKNLKYELSMLFGKIL